MTDSFAHMRNLSELNLSECFSDGRSMEVKKFIDTLFSKCSSLKSVDLSKNALYSYSVENNTIQGFLYSVNGSGELVSLVSTSATTYNPADIEYPRFMTFDFNFTIPSSNYKVALVVREVVAAGGINVMGWTKSNLNNPY